MSGSLGVGPPSVAVAYRAVRRSKALLAVGLVVLAGVAGCGSPGDGAGRPRPASDRAETEALRSEVERLRREVDARLAEDSLVRRAREVEGDVTVGLSTELVTRMLHATTLTYLDDVRLHITPEVVVRESEQVRVSLGPIEVPAGRWDLTVTVERIDARLAVDTVELAVADSNRIAIAVPVRVEEGSGRATIDFRWDATTAASVVCRDFRVRESFAGTVSPYTERLEAVLELEARGRRVVARPRYTGERLVVRPEPTPDAWRRVREILRRQNNIFRCGLAISPDEMEALLRRLLREGFRFEFPESVLKPVALPTVLTEEVTIEGRRFTVLVRPVTLRLDADRLWYGVRLDLAGTDDPVRDGAAPAGGGAAESSSP